MRLRQNVIINFALLVAAMVHVGLSETAAGPATPRGSPPMRINFTCSTLAAMSSSGIQPLAQDLTRTHGGQGVRTWGDRAVAVNLNQDERNEYLVPLSCGATCNCTWGILASEPPSVLGVVSGCVLEVTPPDSGWASVISYEHMSASEGLLTSYAYRDGEYRRERQLDAAPDVVQRYERCKDDESCCP